MSEDGGLRASIATMRDVVARLRRADGIAADDLDTLVAILEEQIDEMERAQGERA